MFGTAFAKRKITVAGIGYVLRQIHFSGEGMMKKAFNIKVFLAIWLSASILLAASSSTSSAEEEKPSGDATVAVLSKYVWRGYELSRNSIVVQPSLTIGYKGFTANLWGNLDTHPYDSGTDSDQSYSSTWNETDVTLSYAKTFGLFNVGGGYIYYSLGSLNPDAPDRLDSQELFASVGLNTILAPTLTVYKEIDHYHNWYFLLGVSHTFELNKMIALKLAASASYLLSTDETTYPEFDGDAMPTDEKFSNFHDGTLTASLPIKATSHLTVTPTISYVFPLSTEAKNEMKGLGLSGEKPRDRDSSYLYGGLTASFAF